MKTPLIHIGWPRTGTTWLQQNVFRAPPFLPAGGRPKALAMKLVYGHRLAEPLDFDPSALRAEYAASTAGSDLVPVISNEALCGHPFRGGIDRADIAARVFATFPRARILITVRAQAALAVSLWELFLRRGGRCGLRAFLSEGEEYHVPMFVPDCLRFDRLARHYAAQYGADNVLVLPLEALAQDAAGYLAALGSFVGAEIPVPAAPAVNGSDYRGALLRRVVPGRATNAAARARGLHAPRWMIDGLAALVPARLAGAAHRRALATAETLLGDRYAESNRHLQAFSPFALAELGYPVSVAPAPDRRSPQRVSAPLPLWPRARSAHAASLPGRQSPTIRTRRG